MSRTYDFLQGCGTFFLLTVNDKSPAGRPIGAIIEHDESLCFSTANTKAVYKQLIANSNLQSIAMKSGTRD